MIIAGITGGIGSGKTTVCRVFEQLGVPVYYADDEARELLNTPEVLKALVKEFGEEIIVSGKTDRKKIANIVFNNHQKLEALNMIVHPAVKLHFDRWCKIQQAPYLLKEAAILFESGTYKTADKIITVTAPAEVRLARVRERDGTTEEEVKKRIASQMSDEEKIKRSDFVIVNDEQHLVIPEILRIHGLLSTLQK